MQTYTRRQDVEWLTCMLLHTLLAVRYEVQNVGVNI